MFSDEILEKIFAHEEMQKIPIGCQSTAVHVFEEILSDAKYERIKTGNLFLISYLGVPFLKRRLFCFL